MLDSTLTRCTHRVVATCVVVAVLLLGCVTAAPPSAHAHASLLGTQPSAEEVVGDAPDEVALEFDESVSFALGGVTVFGPSGDIVSDADARLDDQRLVVGADLGEPGTYAVAWRVVSSDAHPIRGAFVFHVGAPSANHLAQERAEASVGDAPVLDVLLVISRIAAFVGLLVVAGGAVFSLFIAPAVRLRYVVPALVVGVAGLAVSFVVDAMLSGGYSLVEALDPGVVQAQAGTQWGGIALVRVFLLVSGVLVVRVAMGRGVRGRPLHAVGAFLLLAAVAASSLAGHAMATDDQWLRVPLDMLHGIAAACWIGGLVQLAARGAAEHVDADAIRRYSRLAFSSVLLLVATGGWAAFAETDASLDAITSTTYGRLLVGKVVLLAAVLPLGAILRSRVVPSIGADDSAADEGRRQLARLVRIELALLALVIVLTGWLVGTPPAKDAAIPAFVDTTVTMSGPREGSVQFTIDPARVGSNEVHLYVFDEAGAVESDDVEVELELDVPKLGPIELPVEQAGPGHFQARGVTFPRAGKALLRANLTWSEFEQSRVRTTIEIAAPPG